MNSFVNIHLSATNLEKLTSRLDGIEKTVNLYSSKDFYHQETNQQTPVDGTPDPSKPLHPPKVSPLDFQEKVISLINIIARNAM